MKTKKNFRIQCKKWVISNNFLFIKLKTTHIQGIHLRGKDLECKTDMKIQRWQCLGLIYLEMIIVINLIQGLQI